MYDSARIMPVTVLSIFVSLLPRRYRGYWLGDGNLDVRRGAIFSASVQFVLCCAAMWALYPAFVRQHYAELSATMAAAGRSGDKVVEAFDTFRCGPIVIVAYIFRPMTILLLYFALEGVVRLTAAVATDEVIPTMPLQLVAWGHDLAKGKYQEYEMGPRIIDVIEPGVPGKYDFKIRSCRPKDWNHLVTVRYNDQMYEVQSEQTGVAPQPFVYLLQLKPEHKIVRGLRDYDPEEPMRKPGWAEVPENPRK